jgi:hypothetical protein
LFADSGIESTAEPSGLEQAMIPQQAMMKDALLPHTPSALSADADATVTGTDIVYLADLQPQPVEWLWQHRLAAGTLAMLSGEPGSGKTWVALAIAAALTRGRDPFTGEKLKPATVLSASAEHSPPCAAPNSISAFVAPKTENQVPDGGLSRLRRMSTLRSTRQDAQINYLSTLSIFMKQTTYLATLPKKCAGGCYRSLIERSLRADTVVAAVAQQNSPLLAHRVIGRIHSRSIEHDRQSAFLRVTAQGGPMVRLSLGDRVYICRNIRSSWPGFWKHFQRYG